MGPRASHLVSSSPVLCLSRVWTPPPPFTWPMAVATCQLLSFPDASLPCNTLWLQASSVSPLCADSPVQLSAALWPRLPSPSLPLTPASPPQIRSSLLHPGFSSWQTLFTCEVPAPWDPFHKSRIERRHPGGSTMPALVRWLSWSPGVNPGRLVPACVARFCLPLTVCLFPSSAERGTPCPAGPAHRKVSWKEPESSNTYQAQ